MRHHRVLCVVLLALLPACSGTVTARDRVVLAFGDSLTAGHGLAASEAYPALLQARLAAAGYGYRVVNAGVSGDTTAGGLRRVDWALKLQPEVVIVALGANDGLRGLELGAVRANLDRIVERFQASGAKVLLAGMRLPPNYGGAYAGEFEHVYRVVAQQRGVPMMPFLLDGVGGQARLNQADGIHPTAAGQRIMADRLWPYLVPLLAK